jgi:outer membrane protein OmpU
MKKVLFATTALIALAGAAQAEVTLSGDARLGFIYDGDDTVGTSRARVKFSAESTTNSGLTVGMSFRAHAAGKAQNQGEDDLDGDVSDGGEVYVKGAFGAVTYGDTDSAVAKRVSNVDAISLTGLGDLNEITRSQQNGSRIRYDYDASSFGVSVSTEGALDTFAVGASATFGGFAVGIGYDETGGSEGAVTNADLGGHIAASVGATFGAVSLKAAYATNDVFDEYALSAKFTTSSGIGIAAFAHDGDNIDDMIIGVGADYDLGGGAKLVAGVVDSGEDTIADFGISMEF